MAQRVIEAAGVKPDAAGAGGPGALDRIGQQIAAETAARELRQQSEVDDLDAAASGVASEFEVTGDRVADGHHPERYRRIVQIGANLIVGPRQAIDPTVGLTHGRNRGGARTPGRTDRGG